MTLEAKDVEAVKVSGPMGFSLEAAGTKAVAVVLALAATGLILWQLERHEAKSDQNHRETKESLRESKEAISEIVYVLTLPPEKREGLRLDMPDSLRRKARRADQQ